MHGCFVLLSSGNKRRGGGDSGCSGTAEAVKLSAPIQEAPKQGPSTMNIMTKEPQISEEPDTPKINVNPPILYPHDKKLLKNAIGCYHEDLFFKKIMNTP